MKLSLHCPSCARPIGDIHGSTLQVTCATCRSHYGVVYGKLSRRSSIYETLLYLTSKLPRLYRRHYTLQITTPDRALRLLQFSIPGKADDIPVRSGDLVSVIYTMQGYLMKKLVAITNHTTGKRYVLPNPIPSPGYLTLILGFAAIGLLICANISGVSIFLTSVGSALGILAFLKWTNTAQLTHPPLETQGQSGKRLLSDQRLLVQKSRIDHRIDELDHECKTNQVLIEQLENLKRKMTEVDQQLYSARIYRSTSAVKLLKQQIANIHRLIREYRQAIKMIDIEVETSWIADQLPDASDFTRTIVSKLEELKAIEEQNQFLKLQLSAYEEINSLS
ncbi:MAG: hypothetical protein WCA35_17430 [Kovacikia sp.]